MKSICTTDTLPPRTRQMGILAVAAVQNSPYVEYCHELVCPKLGISQEQFEIAISGEIPNEISREEAIAFEIALKLAKDREPLDEESFQKACNVLGRKGVAGLAHVVAGYQYVCLLVNIAGPAPGGWTKGK